MKPITITSAKHLFDYRIEFAFSDGKTTIVDFEKFIVSHKSPYIAPFRSIARFKKFRIKHGMHIVWGSNYDMYFEFKDLYKGGSIPPPDEKKLKRMTIKYFGKKKAEKMFAEAGY